MSRPGTRLGFVLSLCLLTAVAAAPRVYRLGDWSFVNDEVGTNVQVEHWVNGTPEGLELRPDHAIPQTIPVAMAYHRAGLEWFGDSEFGSRLLPAITGVLLVLVTFLLTRAIFGGWVGFATGLLIAVTPEHVFFSQLNRFYALASLTVAMTALCGGIAVRRNSIGWTLLACGFAAVTLLTHTVEAVVLGGLGLGLLLAALAGRTTSPGRVVLQLLVVAATVGGFVAYYVNVLQPVAGAKMGFSPGWSGYGTFSSIAAAVLHVGWWTLPLALVGLIRLWNERPREAAYWFAHALTWLGVAVVLPRVMIYHPEYAFAQSISLFVLAGIGIGWIAERLDVLARPAAIAWMLVVAALPAPGLASCVADGNRHDYRAAARFVGDHLEPGDIVATPTPRILHHYDDRLGRSIPLGLDDPTIALERQLAEEPNARIWVVWATGRSGMEEPHRRWFAEHCVEEAHMGARRFDYHEFTLHVFRTRGQESEVRGQ